MEAGLDNRLDEIMEKPNVIGVLCADNKGLCLGARGVAKPEMSGIISNLLLQAQKLEPNSTSSPVLQIESPQGYCLVQSKGTFSLGIFKKQTEDLTDTSSDSDLSSISDHSTLNKHNDVQYVRVDNVLQSSVRSASFNIVFQISVRIFTFSLNAFVLRYISHEALGICNVRLALLYSTVMFLSREPFRRAVIRKSESDQWFATINLTWLSVPSTIFWSLLTGYVWSKILSQPGHPQSDLYLQYQWSIWIMVLSLVIDSFTEVPYIIGQYFFFYKLRIVGDTLLIAIRALFLIGAVMINPNLAVMAYACGTLVAVTAVLSMYYVYFYYFFNVECNRSLPFHSISNFLPFFEQNIPNLPYELTTVAVSFFKQGILKQLLTEGERYVMTFFDLLSFQEQGLYDLVSNLGSLAARFLFLPVEESSYLFFAKSINESDWSETKDWETSRKLGHILGKLVRMMLITGMIITTFGIPFSNTALHLYGGENLSSSSQATLLLKANCVYIAFLAINGVTEAFTFAAMTKEHLEKFNRKLLMFSCTFLVCAIVFVKLFGSIGFFIANTINMAMRIGQSSYIIRMLFRNSRVNPFNMWKISKSSVFLFLVTFIALNYLQYSTDIDRVAEVFVGGSCFCSCLFGIYILEKDLIQFLIQVHTKDSTK